MGQLPIIRIMSSLALLQSLHLVFMMMFDVSPFYRFALMYFVVISWPMIAKAYASNSENIFLFLALDFDYL